MCGEIWFLVLTSAFDLVGLFRKVLHSNSFFFFSPWKNGADTRFYAILFGLSCEWICNICAYHHLPFKLTCPLSCSLAHAHLCLCSVSFFLPLFRSILFSPFLLCPLLFLLSFLSPYPYLLPSLLFFLLSLKG